MSSTPHTPMLVSFKRGNDVNPQGDYHVKSLPLDALHSLTSALLVRCLFSTTVDDQLVPAIPVNNDNGNDKAMCNVLGVPYLTRQKCLHRRDIILG